MTPIKRGDGTFQVYIPRKLSPTGKRQAKYFPSKNQALKFISEFKAEHLEHGRHGISASDRQTIEFLRSQLGGDLSLVLLNSYLCGYQRSLSIPHCQVGSWARISAGTKVLSWITS